MAWELVPVTFADGPMQGRTLELPRGMRRFDVASDLALHSYWVDAEQDPDRGVVMHYAGIIDDGDLGGSGSGDQTERR